MSSSPINYAKAFGFQSIPAAVIFAVVYLPLFLWFIRQSIKNTTYVYISLSIFCLMRVVAFVMRAILIASEFVGQNLNVLIADEVMFGVGFFALLYSAYTLVLDREIISGATLQLPLKIMRNRRLFRIILIVAVVLGVQGISDSTSSNPKKASTGTDLRRASTIIFLVLTIIQAIQTFLALNAHSGYPPSPRFGDRHGKYILGLISIFLLVREAFLVATISNSSKQNEELFWYPLLALPEFLAVVCYSFSGLVPPRSELKARKADNEYSQA
ncbi:hypothetical protein R3P38DRAFT_2812103 [Favolaschia claudopus]|uniref:DUF7702 domain-containing protein n=1 Tax=Favolaschia claudopus TaxID=2862362 RepID=A0AAV9Z8D2_9AGAR